jgi:hypothetical protein
MSRTKDKNVPKNVISAKKMYQKNVAKKCSKTKIMHHPQLRTTPLPSPKKLFA